MTLDARDTRVFVAHPSAGLDFSMGDNGNNWVWSVCGLYTFCFLVINVLGFKAPYGEKIFHYLFTVSLFVGAVSYFTVASNLGWVPVVASHGEEGVRQMFYSKYINWFVGWTPIITALGLISGISWATIVYNVMLMWIWISCWLCGAMAGSEYRWAYFAFGTLAYFMLALSLLLGVGTAKRNGLGTQYLGIVAWIVGVWLPYNIAWALDDGGNQYSIDRAWIFWGILDIATVPFLSFAILFVSRSWEPTAHNFAFTSHGRNQDEGPEVFPHDKPMKGGSDSGSSMA